MAVPDLDLVAIVEGRVADVDAVVGACDTDFGESTVDLERGVAESTPNAVAAVRELFRRGGKRFRYLHLNGRAALNVAGNVEALVPAAGGVNLSNELGRQCAGGQGFGRCGRHGDSSQNGELGKEREHCGARVTGKVNESASRG